MRTNAVRVESLEAELLLLPRHAFVVLASEFPHFLEAIKRRASARHHA